MRTYDVTLTISPDLVTWPNEQSVILEQVASITEGANANLSRILMGLHSGTHVDAPHHFLNDQRTVEQLSLEVLIGRAYVLHLPDVNVIDASVLERADIPPRTRRILFKTRNSTYWAQGEKAFQTDFVGISADGAAFLVDRNVKLVGIDYLSIAPYKQSRPTHELLLNAGVIIVEGLDLSKVSQGRYTLYCLPLKIAGAEGSPARAILVGV